MASKKPSKAAKIDIGISEADRAKIAAREYGDDDGLIAAVVADVRRISREP